MVLCIVLLLLPVSMAFAWFASRLLLRRFETSPVPYFVTAFILSLLPGLALTVLLGLLGTIAYDGSCYDLSERAIPCTWAEFASSQFFAAAVVGVPLTIFSLPLNMTLFYLRWRVVVL